MSTSDAGAPSGNGASGNGAGIPSTGDGVDIAALVNDAVNKALGARLKRIDLEGQITRAVETAIAKVPAASAEKSQEQTAQAGSDAEPGKLSIKALQEKFDSEMKAMRASLDGERKARADAEQRAKDTRARSEFHAKLAAKMGADHPMLGTLMDSLYDVKKRVVESDGKLAIKFADQYGGEELKSLDEGVNALFENELKHLVQTSKAGSLPSAGFRGNGKPIPGMQAAKGQPQLNALDRDLIEAVAKDRPELAEAMATQALAAQQNK